MDVEIMRAELMRFSKEELVTELLAALVELAAMAERTANGRIIGSSDETGKPT